MNPATMKNWSLLTDKQPEQEGKFDLSPREVEVLEQLVKGLANKVIARNLHIEETTVKLHLRSLFKKMNVNNRTEAVFVAMDSGLFTQNRPDLKVTSY